MAGFCTKCGAPLASDSGFCTACGAPVTPLAAPPLPSGYAPVATPAVVPPAAYSAPAATAPPAGGYTQMSAGGVPPAGYPPAATYAAAPAKSSGGALKIILIVIAVIVGLGVIAAGVVAYGVYKVAHSVHMDKNGDTASVSVPGGGSFSVGNTNASDDELGVPAYPGAVREKGGLNMNAGGTSMVMAHFSTNDSTSQVVDFYKGKLGTETVSVATGTNNGTVLNSAGNPNDRIMVTVGDGSGTDEGKTTIVIMHTKKK